MKLARPTLAAFLTLFAFTAIAAEPNCRDVVSGENEGAVDLSGFARNGFSLGIDDSGTVLPRPELPAAQPPVVVASPPPPPLLFAAVPAPPTAAPRQTSLPIPVFGPAPQGLQYRPPAPGTRTLGSVVTGFFRAIGVPVPWMGPPATPPAEVPLDEEDIPFAELADPEPPVGTPALPTPAILPVAPPPVVVAAPTPDDILAPIREELQTAPWSGAGMDIPTQSLADATRQHPNALPFFVFRHQDRSLVERPFQRREDIRPRILETLDEALSRVDGRGLFSTTLPTVLASRVAESGTTAEASDPALGSLAIGVALRLEQTSVDIPERRAMELVNANPGIVTDANRNNIALRLQAIFGRFYPVTVTTNANGGWTVQTNLLTLPSHFETVSLRSLAQRVSELSQLLGRARLRGSISIALPTDAFPPGRWQAITRVLAGLLTLDRATRLAQHQNGLSLAVDELGTGRGGHIPYPSNVIRIEGFDTTVPRTLERTQLLLAYALELANTQRGRWIFAPRGTPTEVSLRSALFWASGAFGRLGRRFLDGRDAEYATWRSNVLRDFARLVEAHPNMPELREELRQFLNLHSGLDIPPRAILSLIRR